MRNSTLASCLFLVSSMLFWSLSAKAQQGDQEVTHVLWFGGGGAQGDSEQIREALSGRLSGAQAETQSLLLLGDQLAKGLPDGSSKQREIQEALLKARLKPFLATSSPVYVMPGDLDWDDNGRLGWARVINQSQQVDSLFAHSTVANASSGFYPKSACPGPVELPLGEEAVLIIFDSQWLIHPWDKPRIEDGCGIDGPEDMLVAFTDALERNAHKKIVVASHHPLYNTGAWSKAFIPGMQNINHPRYKALVSVLSEVMNRIPNIVHLAGHGQSQQYGQVATGHYIVSDALGKTVNPGKGNWQFTSAEQGYGRLVFYKSGRVLLEFFEQGAAAATYSQELYSRPYVAPVTAEEYASEVDLRDSLVTFRASTQYNIKESSYWLNGENYRAVWNTPVQAPVFDIGSARGGLKIVQRGGGQQTKSLRLEAKNGKQYVLRSVEKFAKGAIPPALRSTFAADLIQDQISASNPYAAYIIPPLADAARVYHTNPQVVFIPNDPRFGPYQRTFAGTLALYEERPDDDWSDADFFGNSKKIRSTAKVLEKLAKDNDNSVDEHWVAKSRLFDLMIGDWDRHDDQWRWASFEDKETGGEYYRPIPRDRDQAFFINNGFLMSIIKRKWAMPKFQGWDYEYLSVEHFSYNARYFDRTFLTGLSRQDWVEIAEELQANVTDEVIEQAVKQWQEPIFKLRGEETIAKLKANRDKLRNYAERLYTLFATEVDIKGSDKKELFKVERLSDEETRVRVWKLSKKKDEKRQKLYDRTFLASETREVRLFGMGDDDEFEVEGDTRKGILVRIIGGEGNDEITDESRVRRGGRKTIVYDTQSGNELKLGKESKDRTSDKEGVNAYDRKAFKYPWLVPLVNFNFNPDDGIFLGGGFLLQKHGFRKSPFKTSHQVLVSTALATQSFTFDYKGIFTEVVGSLDFELSAQLREPNFVTNFFGVGNETTFNQQADETFNVPNPISYYRTRFSGYGVKALLRKKFGKRSSFAFGPHLESAVAESDGYDGEDRFILDLADQTGDRNFFDNRLYGGMVMELVLEGRDNPLLPKKGWYFRTELSGYSGLNDASLDYGQVETELAWYKTLQVPGELTFATRIRGGHNVGDAPFFLSQSLSGNAELRGYRQTRFFGDSKFVNNIDLRLKLFSFNNQIVPSSVGLTFFHDIGRVWVSGENSDKWHQGYGAGIWIAPLDTAVLSFDVGTSEEETIFYIRFGHLF